MHRSASSSFVPRIAAAAGLSLLFFGGGVHADTLQVEPEQLRLSEARPVAHLRYSNSSDTESTLNFKIVQWEQRGDREWLTPSTKLIVLPERLKLKPGESAKVKVSMRLSGSWWEEQAYRIMVTETKPKPDVGANTGKTSGGRITKPSSVPVFLQPPGRVTPRISWTFKRVGQDAVILSATNSGKGHVRMESASLLGPEGASMHKPRMADILLPGGARSWEFPSYAATGTWHLIAETNAGPMRVTFELSPDDSSVRALSQNQ